MRKLIIILGIVVVLLGGGGWYAKYLVTQKVSDQLVTELKSPDIQKQINKMLKDQKVQAALSSMGNNAVAVGSSDTASTSGSTPNQSTQSSTNSGSKPFGSHPTGKAQGSGTNKTHKTLNTVSTSEPSTLALRNRADVIRFAMSRFSTAQILHFMTLYLHRNSLTSEQKDELKTEVLSRFTPQEIQAMAVAVNK